MMPVAGRPPRASTRTRLGARPATNWAISRDRSDRIVMPSRYRADQASGESGEVCRDFFVAVGALFLRPGGMVSMFRFHRILGGPPRRQATPQRPRLAALLSEKLRHTGACTFVGSGAVGDDLAVGGQGLEVSQDFGHRTGSLKATDDRFGRNPDGARDSVTH